jgi:hypothetical protein
MVRNPVFKVALIAIAVIGLLSIVGMLLMGGLMARSIWWHAPPMAYPDAEEGGRIPPAAYHGGRRGVFMPVLGGGTLCLVCGLPLLMLVLAGAFFRRRAWKRRCGHWNHLGGWHGPPPPWFWGKEAPSEEQIARMKRWKKEHGMPPWWADWTEAGSEPAEEPPKEEPR